MKKSWLALVVLGVIAVAPPARAVLLEADTKSYPVTANHRVRLEFPVGELRVVPNDDTHVRLSLRVKCRGGTERCEERASRLEIESSDKNGVLKIKVTGFPKFNNGGFNLIGELQVPRAIALDLEMGVGDLNIDGLEGDLDVELGVGDADIYAPVAKTRSVEIDTGVGDASIRGAGTRTSSRGFIGRSTAWNDGPGRSTVRLNVGVGDATVHLN